jgi:four helix bundle protein
MSSVKSHRDLEVWKVAVGLAKDLYEVTERFPKGEQFGLVAQMRRNAVSIPSNIAEGAARHGTKELIQFLYIAAGSASELDTQMEIAKAVGIGSGNEIDRLQTETERVAMMLRALIRSLKS